MEGAAISCSAAGLLQSHEVTLLCLPRRFPRSSHSSRSVGSELEEPFVNTQGNLSLCDPEVMDIVGAALPEL